MTRGNDCVTRTSLAFHVTSVSLRHPAELSAVHAFREDREGLTLSFRSVTERTDRSLGAHALPHPHHHFAPSEEEEGNMR